MAPPSKMRSFVLLSLFLVASLGEAFIFRPTVISPAVRRTEGSFEQRRNSPPLAVGAAAAAEDEAAVIGRKYRVVGYEYKPGRYANLKVYEDCGDPYSEVVSHLRHGDIVEATGYRNFAGQTWIQHTVDERKQGLYKVRVSKRGVGLCAGIIDSRCG